MFYLQNLEMESQWYYWENISIGSDQFQTNSFLNCPVPLCLLCLDTDKLLVNKMFGDVISKTCGSICSEKITDNQHWMWHKHSRRNDDLIRYLITFNQSEDTWMLLMTLLTLILLEGYLLMSPVCFQFIILQWKRYGFKGAPQTDQGTAGLQQACAVLVSKRDSRATLLVFH